MCRTVPRHAVPHRTAHRTAPVTADAPAVTAYGGDAAEAVTQLRLAAGGFYFLAARVLPLAVMAGQGAKRWVLPHVLFCFGFCHGFCAWLLSTTIITAHHNCFH